MQEEDDIKVISDSPKWKQEREEQLKQGAIETYRRHGRRIINESTGKAQVFPTASDAKKRAREMEKEGHVVRTIF